MKPRFKRRHRENGGHDGGQNRAHGGGQNRGHGAGQNRAMTGAQDSGRHGRRNGGRNGGRSGGRNAEAARHPQQDLQPLPARPPQRESLPLKIDVLEGGIAFEAHVVPRSARSHVSGTHGDRLHVKVNAPPVEGAANQVVCATIAKALGVSQRQVSIVRGVASRMKRIQVEGLSEADARKALAGDPA